MPLVSRLGLRTLLLVLLAWASICANGEAADKIPGLLTVRDALTLPNHPVRIDARLTAAAWATIARGAPA